jgi:hypothetical protein
VSVPAIITAPPATTIAALSTDKVTTSRTLPVVAVSERTAPRSHRGLPAASHTDGSADTNCLQLVTVRPGREPLPSLAHRRR